MTCGVCKGDFCFICLQSWEDVCGLPEIHRCPQYGDPTYDEEGYDLRGFHRDTGYDRDGYNIRGLNAAGRNRRGGTQPIYYRGRRKQRTQLYKEPRLNAAEATADRYVHLLEEVEQYRFASSDIVRGVQIGYNDDEDEFEDPLMDDLNVTTDDYWADYSYADDYDDTAEFFITDEDPWANLEVIEGLEPHDEDYWRMAMEREQVTPQAELTGASHDGRDILSHEDRKDSGHFGSDHLRSQPSCFFTPFGRLHLKV